MQQVLQTNDTHRLRSVPGQGAGTASDLPMPTLDHLAAVDGQGADVIPLFGDRDIGPWGVNPVAGDTRSAMALRGWLVQSLLLEAIIRDEVGDVFAARRALERALEFAERDRVVLPFTVDPAPALLERHARCRPTHADLISEIFAVLDSHRLVTAPSSPPSPVTSEELLEPLTDGEARVLRYLPTNLSKREIAQELYVSVHTIKTHMKHIYLKLDAHNRHEAVQRAREYGLMGRG
jgi:LuxR family transcriptional regulator, maltose regulon positive regulatory protein